MQNENLYTPDCLRTYSGQYVNLKKPDLATIYIGDIAHHLSYEPRFAGACKRHWTVADHSLLCLDIAERKYPGQRALHLAVLLHDAHEYLLKDVPSPLKRMLVGYLDIANRLQAAIEDRFGLQVTPAQKVIIDAIDREALEEEWEKKVVRSTGITLDHRSTNDLFLLAFQQLCTHPHTIWP